jgi:type IV pilus assembly protein PilV
MSKRAFGAFSQLQAGTILLEVLVSMLILALGVLSIVGLQAAAIRNTTDAKLRADAGFVANRTISQMWANPSGLDTFKQDKADLPASDGLPSGKRTVVVNGRQVTVTITWQPPGGDIRNVQMVAHINE